MIPLVSDFRIVTEMDETTEKRKPSKDDAKVIQLASATSTVGGKRVDTEKSIQFDRGPRRKKQTPIAVQRDDEADYR